MAHERMLDLLRRFHFLGARVGDADLLIELPIDGDVHVLVDSRRDHRAHLLAKEGGQVAAAAHEAHSEGRLADDHASVQALTIKSARVRASWTGADSSFARDVSRASTAASVSPRHR